jgi:hypothetical protein
MIWKKCKCNIILIKTQTSKAVQLTQSATAIGAAIAGFAIGAQRDSLIKGFAVAILIMGAIIHTYGMYVNSSTI